MLEGGPGHTLHMAATRVYAGWALGLRLEDVPDGVREAAALHLLDALGCGLAACGLRTAPYGEAAAGELPGPATVLGRTAGVPPDQAALANGILLHALDFDDTHAASIAHVSAVVVPAALAAAEARQATGADLLAALLAGSEVTCRVGLPAGDAFHHRGFHPTAICGVFGATVAVGRLGGLDEDTLVQALGIAGSMASGLLAYLSDGAATKRIHPGWMAHAAHMAVRLAASGATGPERVLEDRAGVYRAFLGRDVDPGPAAATLGTAWETRAVAFKPYPACHFIHPMLDALAATGLGREDIDRVTVLAPKAALDMVGWPIERKRRPTTTYDAKFSAPFSIGALLVDGRVDVTTYTEERLSDREILAVADRVDAEERDSPTFPASFAGGVRARTRAGRETEYHLEHQRGGPEWPMPPEDVRAKFRDNARVALDDAGVAALESAALGVAELPSLAPLVARLRAARARA
jgi:2-methylcitrate dehydratase PrpD